MFGPAHLFVNSSAAPLSSIAGGFASEGQYHGHITGRWAQLTDLRGSVLEHRSLSKPDWLLSTLPQMNLEQLTSGCKIGFGLPGRISKLNVSCSVLVDNDTEVCAPQCWGRSHAAIGVAADGTTYAGSASALREANLKLSMLVGGSEWLVRHGVRASCQTDATNWYLRKCVGLRLINRVQQLL